MHQQREESSENSQPVENKSCDREKVGRVTKSKSNKLVEGGKSSCLDSVDSEVDGMNEASRTRTKMESQNKDLVQASSRKGSRNKKTSKQGVSNIDTGTNKTGNGIEFTHEGDNIKITDGPLESNVTRKEVKAKSKNLGAVEESCRKSSRNKKTPRQVSTVDPDLNEMGYDIEAIEDSEDVSLQTSNEPRNEVIQTGQNLDSFIESSRKSNRNKKASKQASNVVEPYVNYIGKDIESIDDSDNVKPKDASLQTRKATKKETKTKSKTLSTVEDSPRKNSKTKQASRQASYVNYGENEINNGIDSTDDNDDVEIIDAPQQTNDAPRNEVKSTSKKSDTVERSSRKSGRNKKTSCQEASKIDDTIEVCSGKESACLDIGVEATVRSQGTDDTKGRIKKGSKKDKVMKESKQISSGETDDEKVANKIGIKNGISTPTSKVDQEFTDIINTFSVDKRKPNGKILDDSRKERVEKDDKRHVIIDQEKSKEANIENKTKRKPKRGLANKIKDIEQNDEEMQSVGLTESVCEAEPFSLTRGVIVPTCDSNIDERSSNVNSEAAEDLGCSEGGDLSPDCIPCSDYASVQNIHDDQSNRGKNSKEKGQENVECISQSSNDSYRSEVCDTDVIEVDKIKGKDISDKDQKEKSELEKDSRKGAKEKKTSQKTNVNIDKSPYVKLSPLKRLDEKNDMQLKVFSPKKSHTNKVKNKTVTEAIHQSEQNYEGKFFKEKRQSAYKQVNTSSFGFDSPGHIDSSGDSCKIVNEKPKKTTSSMRKSVLFYMSYSQSNCQEHPTPTGDAGYDPYDFDAECASTISSKCGKKTRPPGKFYSQDCFNQIETYSKQERKSKKEAKKKKSKSPKLTFASPKAHKSKHSHKEIEAPKTYKSKISNKELKAPKSGKSKISHKDRKDLNEVNVNKEKDYATPESVKLKSAELDSIDRKQSLILEDDDVTYVNPFSVNSLLQNQAGNLGGDRKLSCREPGVEGKDRRTSSTEQQDTEDERESDQEMPERVSMLLYKVNELCVSGLIVSLA